MTQTSTLTLARRRLLILLATLAGFALTLAACGADDSVTAGSVTAGSDPTQAPAEDQLDESTDDSVDESAGESEQSDSELEVTPTDAPPVNVTRGENSLTLRPWSYCWTSAGADIGICADGAPPASPKLLAGDGPITLAFPADFSFSAGVFDESFGEEIADAVITKVDAGWDIDPGVEGPAVIEVFGKGPEGDVSVSFAID